MSYANSQILVSFTTAPPTATKRERIDPVHVQTLRQQEAYESWQKEEADPTQPEEETEENTKAESIPTYHGIVRKESDANRIDLSTASIASAVLARHPDMADSNRNIRIKVYPAPPAAAPSATATVAKNIDANELNKLLGMGLKNTQGPWFCDGSCKGKKQHFKIRTYGMFVKHMIQEHAPSSTNCKCNVCDTHLSNLDELIERAMSLHHN